MSNPQLVTVLGGTGFIGRYVVQTLVEQGCRVRVACRNPNLGLFLKPLGEPGQIQLVKANITNRASLASAVAGADSVVNLVGILFEGGKQGFDAVQRDGAIALAETAKAAGARRFVHLSAIGAHSTSDANYARTKGEAEAGVLKVFPSATIFRPSIVFGAEDGFFNRFASMAKWPLPVMPVLSGDTRFQPVYVKDVAAAVLAATVTNACEGQTFESQTFEGQTFELGGPTVYSFRELIQYILKTVLVEKPLIDVPMPVARLQAMVLGLAPKPLLTTDQLKMLAHDNVVSATAMGFAALGIAPTPVEAIVPTYLARYRPKGQFS